jgi:hypothetical protein
VRDGRSECTGRSDPELSVLDEDVGLVRADVAKAAVSRVTAVRPGFRVEALCVTSHSPLSVGQIGRNRPIAATGAYRPESATDAVARPV